MSHWRKDFAELNLKLPSHMEEDLPENYSNAFYQPHSRNNPSAIQVDWPPSRIGRRVVGPAIPRLRTDNNILHHPSMLATDSRLHREHTDIYDSPRNAEDVKAMDVEPEYEFTEEQINAYEKHRRTLMYQMSDDFQTSPECTFTSNEDSNGSSHDSNNNNNSSNRVNSSFSSVGPTKYVKKQQSLSNVSVASELSQLDENSDDNNVSTFSVHNSNTEEVNGWESNTIREETEIQLRIATRQVTEVTATTTTRVVTRSMTRSQRAKQ